MCASTLLLVLRGSVAGDEHLARLSGLQKSVCSATAGALDRASVSDGTGTVARPPLVVPDHEIFLQRSARLLCLRTTQWRVRVRLSNSSRLPHSAVKRVHVWLNGFLTRPYASAKPVTRRPPQCGIG